MRGWSVKGCWRATGYALETKTHRRKQTMSYITNHRVRLEHRHYVTTAQTGTHWFNFYAKKLRDYRREYADDFCLVINCSDVQDQAYILRYAEVEDCFTPQYLNGPRWIGTVRNDNLTVSLAGKPIIELHVGRFLNAFELLQNAPQPLPPKLEVYV
jgi:hypothetical protein